MKYFSGKNVVLALGTILFTFLLFSAARFGATDLLSRYIRSEIDTWSASSVGPDFSAVDSLNRVLKIANFISPNNPDHLEDQARLALIYSGLPVISVTERENQLKNGIDQITAAIALRPVSSYSWATLLLLKRAQASYDAEFRHALERTVTLGPWEPDVQSIVADVGLSAWAALPVAEQEMIRKNFVRGMKRQAEVMIAIAQSHQNDCKGAHAKQNASCVK
jgi:hypothetical protein